MSEQAPDKVAKFTEFFQGDRDAVSFALMVVDIASLWDDLIDKDQEVTELEINRAMTSALCGIPRNRFYRKHIDELLPLMEISVFGWLASNDLVRYGGEKGLEVANVVRNSVANLFVHMARLIGGVGWAATVAPDIYLLVQSDTFSEFVKEF